MDCLGLYFQMKILSLLIIFGRFYSLKLELNYDSTICNLQIDDQTKVANMPLETLMCVFIEKNLKSW